ncbi:MAG: hydantoinase/oxoprolinase family protein [Gammaproteobacteria bacterium]|nr:hydantoinase/oxoprolinase family protein [Gammaproteobacteria bacterium]MDE0366921.1 hydantoinase/oxoprolinase family protein [Gammaproteobacteria bacterium]
MSGVRVAADIGGTFTDVVLDDGGRQYSSKVLTTYKDPADAVLAGLKTVLDEANRQPGDVGLFLHGTTLATNALIERRGACTALLTTEGHRDALEMAFENRFEQYDVNIDRPAPLVPRHLRIPIRERLAADGEVLIPLDPVSVANAAEVLAEEGVESVAIGFLHGYRKPDHERAVARTVRERLPGVAVTLACEVCPEIREFERLSTACANAYVQPLMASYLQSLEDQLTGQGVRCPILLMTSGGGLTDLPTAVRFPIRLVESGPAGGAILAADLAARCGLDEVLSLDMGGTTAKICLIDGAEPQLSRQFEVGRTYRFKKGSGLPMRIPVIEMVEIGAGGGSIASVDSLGRIQVGPESAGSEPGPACYGLGGRDATVTDADVVLGKIRPEHFAGGSLRLDDDGAAAAVESGVAAPLSLDRLGGAVGICEVIDENMAAAARAHAIEWGRETAGRTMIAYGGAAPLHACLLATKLKVDRILVPRGAAVGSALGFLLAPVSFEVVRSRYMILADLDPAWLGELLDGMRQEAAVVVSGATSEPLEETARAHMRYVGQGFEISVEVPRLNGDDEVRSRLGLAFEAAYRTLYGRTIPGADVEILSWTLALSTRRQVPEPLESPERMHEACPDSRVSLYDPVRRALVDGALYHRDSLAPGDTCAGPALIVESQTTTVVTEDFHATVNGLGHLYLERVSHENSQPAPPGRRR